MGIGRAAEKVWWETTTPPVLGKEVHQTAYEADGQCGALASSYINHETLT